MCNIECENLLKDAFLNGINIFCGAGFSMLAKNAEQKPLPTGNALLSELKADFDSIKVYSKLSSACTKLKETDRTSFEYFITNRFEVNSFDPLYYELEKINIRNIFTTNVDNLWFKIFDRPGVPKCLIDRAKKGAIYENKDGIFINYYALHGSVNNKSGYVFGTTDIASAFKNADIANTWNNLAQEAASFPILFWGWNFNDYGPLEAIYGGKKNINDNINKWFVLYEGEDNLEETKDLLKTLGFNLIISNTKDFLEYIKNSFSVNTNNKETDSEKTISLSFKRKYFIPRREELPSPAFFSFFTTYKPEWSFFYNQNVHKTIYYKELADKIASHKDIIVTGIRGAGKTTLMMQLLIDLTTATMKNYLIEPALEQVKVYLSELKGRKAILFIDGCFRDTEALSLLLDAKNVQMIGFDRDFNYESQSHKIANKDYYLVDITELNIKDAQHILNTIPAMLKRNGASTKNFDKDPTIPTFLAKVLKNVNYNFLQRFYDNDSEAAEVFLLICYVHYCGVPCSFDMIYTYLGDEKYTWQSMYEIIERSGKLITEYTDNSLFFSPTLNEDYYQCRSRFFAEKILDSIQDKKIINLLKKVILKVLNDIPIYKICNYDKFKKTAYDANLMAKVFSDKLEGEKFYSLCIRKDNTEYMYQQAALYFSRLKEYKKAFEWIDKAKTLEHYNRFSIESTYAIIYFYANYKITNGQGECKQALNILEHCCRNDKRKATHFVSFARAVINYIEFYKDVNKNEIINSALNFIEEGLNTENKALCKNHKYELRNLGKKLELIMKNS